MIENKILNFQSFALENQQFIIVLYILVLLIYLYNKPLNIILKFNN